jgi:hypothetical protein
MVTVVSLNAKIAILASSPAARVNTPAPCKCACHANQVWLFLISVLIVLQALDFGSNDGLLSLQGLWRLSESLSRVSAAMH